MGEHDHKSIREIRELRPRCGCTKPKPCECDPPVWCTKCDLDRDNNMWLERGPNPGDDLRPGICLLDTMKPSQIVYTLEHNPMSARALLRITSDPYLRYLACQVTLLPTEELVDMEQNNLNREGTPGTYPFYDTFAGQPPLPQIRREGDNVDDD